MARLYKHGAVVAEWQRERERMTDGRTLYSHYTVRYMSDGSTLVKDQFHWSDSELRHNTGWKLGRRFTSFDEANTHLRKMGFKLVSANHTIPAPTPKQTPLQVALAAL